MSNSEVWPVSRSRWAAWPAARASSSAIEQLRRVAERVQRADLGQRLEHRAGSTSRRSMRGQRSAERRERRPPSARAAMIDSIAPWPTFLTASSPKRIASPSTVKSRPLRVDVRRAAPRCPCGGTRRSRRRPSPSLSRNAVRTRGHVLDRVVRLQVGGLVGDQAVARGVGLVEAVALERLERLEDRVDDVRLHAALRGLLTNFSFWARSTSDFFLRIA